MSVYNTEHIQQLLLWRGGPDFRSEMLLMNRKNEKEKKKSESFPARLTRPVDMHCVHMCIIPPISIQIDQVKDSNLFQRQIKWRVLT